VRSSVLTFGAAILAILPGVCYGTSGATAADGGIPQFDHVFVIVEENQSFDDVVGNTADMPYLNSLIRNYGLATNYYANAHPSVNDYFFLTAGHAGFSSSWTADGFLADHHWASVAGENVATILTDNKKTWKAYLEGLPETGSLTASHSGYVKRHDPFAYFASVVHGDRNHPSQRANLVPFTPNFQKDLQSWTFPNYSFIVPDIYNDGHNNATTRKAAGCGDHAALKQIDDWLNKNIRPLVENAEFQRRGLLIIVFDEACDKGSKADNRLDPAQPSMRGGGHIPAVVVSSKTKSGTRLDRLLHHESMLRLTLRALGIQQFPGGAASAPDVDEFFVKP
jgi:acid phosphatase